jgi:hypothetical protein
MRMTPETRSMTESKSDARMEREPVCRWREGGVGGLLGEAAAEAAAAAAAAAAEEDLHGNDELEDGEGDVAGEGHPAGRLIRRFGSL